MRKTILGAIIVGGLMVSTTTAMAGGVGFANVQDIFETSPLGKAKVTADEKKLKPQMDQLKQNITTLQEKVNAYTQEKGDVQTKNAQAADKVESQDKQQVQADLEKAMKDYQNLMNQVQKMASDDADAFKDALTKASAQVAKEKQFDAILPAEMSLYNVDSIDVTKDVIAKMQ